MKLTTKTGAVHTTGVNPDRLLHEASSNLRLQLFADK